MKNFILNHKILFIFLLSIICFFSTFITNVNAATSVSELNTGEIELVIRRALERIEEEGYDSNLFTKYFILNDTNIVFFTENSSFIVAPWDSKRYELRGTNNLAVDFDLETLEIINFKSNMDNQVGNPWACGYTNTVVYTTFDMCYGDTIIVSKNIDFFQIPPQVVMMEITQVEELPTAIIQIVQIILPVFLVIFGVLLVLYLIKSKNLLHL